MMISYLILIFFHLNLVNVFLFNLLTYFYIILLGYQTNHFLLKLLQLFLFILLLL